MDSSEIKTNENNKTAEYIAGASSGDIKAGECKSFSEKNDAGNVPADTADNVEETVKPLGNRTIAEYTAELSSSAPVPGGGGTAAAAAAFGAALGAMVAYLTVGKKKYAAVEEQMTENIKELERLQRDFLDMMDRDAVSFAPLAAAYRMPKETEEEKAERNITIQQCLAAAAEAPLEVMRTSAETVALLENVAENGSRLAISDAGCGAALVKAAMKSAALNVFINTRLMKDRDKAREMNTEAREILEEYGRRADAVYESVYDSLTEQ